MRLGFIQGQDENRDRIEIENELKYYDARSEIESVYRYMYVHDSKRLNQD